MRIELNIGRGGSIDRATIAALVHKEIYLRQMPEDDLVDRIAEIIETAGVRVTRKGVPRERRAR